MTTVNPHDPTVTIAVLNFNGLAYLADCFASLSAVDYPQDRLELMLVDNGSTDASVEFIQRNFPTVKLVLNKRNLGFAAGNNAGARAASSQYIAFLNNDMKVNRQFVRSLVDALRSDPDVVCVGARILSWDGKQVDFAGAAADFAGHGYQLGFGEAADPGNTRGAQTMLYACGGAMLVERQTFLDVGGFDEDYFALFEDVDLGWRLWLLGYKVHYAPSAVSYHHHHGTIKRISAPQQELWHIRNALYTIVKNYSDDHMGAVLSSVLLATTDGIAQRALTDRKQADNVGKGILSLGKSRGTALAAIHEVVVHLPQIMEKRRFVQTHRRRSDKDLAHLFRMPFHAWPGATMRSQYPIAEALGLSKLFEDLPRRVMLISSDILPFPGLPTVGSGLRAWGLAQGLTSRGHQVICSMPRAALRNYSALVPEEIVRMAWETETLPSLIRACQPDVAVICNWPNLDTLPVESLDVPVVLDQHGPHLMERQFQNFGRVEDNTRHKINALRKADFFTCAGNKQLDYFRAWLEKAGWTEHERLTLSAAMPVSLSPDMPARQPREEMTFVYGGVFLPWQDPSLGLTVLVDLLEQYGQGQLRFFGGPHPVYPVQTGGFQKLLQQLRRSSRVIIGGMVTHDALIAEYTQAHVAIDLMQRNPERELAFTTRTVEYLWCGLPVIYNDYSELSDYIRDYEAGWIVDPSDRKAITDVISGILEHPEQVSQRSRNAQRLAHERFTWDRTIEPLDRFLRQLTVRPGAQRYYATTNVETRRFTDPAMIRYLWEQARWTFQSGGLKTLARAGTSFIRRRIGHPAG